MNAEFHAPNERYDKMKQKLESFQKFGKAIAPYLLILWLVFMLLFFVLENIFPPRPVPPEPKITISNLGLCVDLSWTLVERFEVGDDQYICGYMETDVTYPIVLNLYVFNTMDGEFATSSSGTYSSGRIMFYVEPLPPGKYLAKINRFRQPSFIEFDFEVVEKNR